MTNKDLSSDGQNTFVVSDLEQRIRESALLNSSVSCDEDPLKDTGVSSPPFCIMDQHILPCLEDYARSISANLDVLLRDLRGSLRGMADLTVEAIQCYADSISSSCDAVDAVIKNTYAMLAKAEELSDAMRGIEQLAQRIKEIRRTIDVMESQSNNR
ncbi:hypothetical protein AB6A40_006199 [Gnathostoma spinigerum]|uniref:BLOC-1-related complex subunit 6 C-terminal helix domain-containing protein n=1 Tax=Gnathostoma spinigerum TaxID=75299 RepID=A0ABD6EHN0_9BILA